MMAGYGFVIQNDYVLAWEAQRSSGVSCCR